MRKLLSVTTKPVPSKPCLAAYQRKERAGLLIMATGTGKTRTAIALVDVLMKANAGAKSFIPC